MRAWKYSANHLNYEFSQKIGWGFNKKAGHNKSEYSRVSNEINRLDCKTHSVIHPQHCTMAVCDIEML